MHSDETLLFDEGAAFVFIETLGEGNNGRADLVRSVYDNKYYVRKQLTTAYPVGRDIYDRPQREIKMATRLRDFEGVAQLQGWFIYADRARDYITGDVATFEVTYWDYYNAGTLHSIIRDAAARNVLIPEYWVCSWLIQGIAILLDLHDAGFAHRDAHGGNWFLHRTVNDTPELFLGDFDDVTKRFSTRDSRETQKIFQSDYKKLANALREVLTVSDRRDGSLSALLIVMSRWSSTSLGRGSRIDHRMEILCDQAREIQRQLPLPTRSQISLASPRRLDSISSWVLDQFRVWSPIVQRFMPILPDPGFEIIASRGWEKPFIDRQLA